MTRFPAGCSWLLLAVLIAIAGCQKTAPPSTPAVPVNVALVRRADVPVLIRATGTVEPIQTAEIQAQVSGQLLHVTFKEGDEVTAGQVLFQIDPRPFQAALDQAEANLARDAAQWQSAQHDVDRYLALAAKDYVTQQQLDQSKAAANALVGTLRADSAGIEQARLNVQYATIRAPISGRTGGLLLHEGNQVRGGVGQTLVLINQLSPILVRFPVAADSFDAVRLRASQGLAVDAAPAADSSRTEHGTLVFLDNAVDTNTSTVTLKANFSNADHALWPGALVRVSLQLGVQPNVLVVPASAVQSSQAGDVIWIADSANKARVIKVKVLRNTDTLVVIASGASSGQRVITDGQLRLTDGATVAIRKPATARTAPTAGGDSGAPEHVSPATATKASP